MQVNVSPMEALGLLIAAGFALLFLVIGGMKIRKSQQDPDRNPMSNAVGMMLGAIVSIMLGLWIIKDNLSGNGESISLVMRIFNIIINIFFPVTGKAV